MRQHTIIGERIIGARARAARRRPRSSARATSATTAAATPTGSRGEEIPLGARIVAVCDAYDAMITDRPYRRGRAPREALEELERCAGGQFDPAVVAAFTAAMANDFASMNARWRVKAPLSGR